MLLSPFPQNRYSRPSTMTSSINKSIDSSRTSTTSGPGTENPFPSSSAPAPAHFDACCYDPTVRGSRVSNIPFYVAARVTNIVLALVLLALALVAEFTYDRGTWVNPILTPALTAWGYCCYDVFQVFRVGRRVHPHIRIMYDGVCLGTGLAVASGFLTAWAVQSAPEIGYTVSAPILVGMYGMMAVEYGLGVDGVRQVVQMRRGTWQNN